MDGNLGVTVVVVCYNHERYVTESLDSILAQTRTPERVLIIDDASEDGTVSRIESWLSLHPEAGYELVVHSQNTGLCCGLNEALATISTPFYTYISADDRMLPERLDALIDRWAKDGGHAVAVYSNARRIDADGQLLQPDYRTLHEWPSDPEALEGNIHTRLLRHCWLPAASVLVSTEAVRAVQGYDERWFFEDHDLWLRLAATGSFLVVDQPLVEFRELQTSLGHERFTQGDIGFLQARVGIFAKQVGVSAGGDAYIREAMTPLAIRLWKFGGDPTLVQEALETAHAISPSRALRLRLLLLRCGARQQPAWLTACEAAVRGLREFQMRVRCGRNDPGGQG
ncbi:glycosyltransferase [Dermacoccus nishinomiyaensis]|nr:MULTISPECIES: glycosyltransferase [Dermacoccus]TJZ95537.1 glycosyltransferase [Dermacoccus nishinomiyaensis]